MSKDFEFKQLLKAYRQGVISEATFEQEVASIGGSTGNSTGPDGAGFKAFGKSYPSEREAILDFLDNYGSAEAAAGVALDRYASIAKNDCVAGGMRMVAEREAYHGRIFERRLRELGGQKKNDGSETARALEYYFDPNLSDTDKLLQATSTYPDPMTVLQPIFDFGEAIKEDQLTKQLVQLYAKDELGSTKWAYGMAATIGGNKAAAQAAWMAKNPA